MKPDKVKVIIAISGSLEVTMKTSCGSFRAVTLTPPPPTGVTHNIPLLRDILTEERFVSGNISTNYLPEVYPDGFKGKQVSQQEKVRGGDSFR